MKSSKKFLTRVLTAALALSMVAGTGICAAAADTDVDEEEAVVTSVEEEAVVITDATQSWISKLISNGLSKDAAKQIAAKIVQNISAKIPEETMQKILTAAQQIKAKSQKYFYEKGSLYLVEGDFVYQVHTRVKGSYAEVVAYTGSDTEITIPAWADNLPVTKLDILAFDSMDEEYLQSVTTLNIPFTVENISTAHLFALTNLQNVNIDPINPYYTSVDGAVFDKNVTKLIALPLGRTEYVIPDTVTTIGEYACWNAQIESITLPESLTFIGEAAFIMCFNLKEVDIPNGTTIIGDAAFAGCDSLEKVVIPSSVTKIYDFTFDGWGENFTIWCDDANSYAYYYAVEHEFPVKAPLEAELHIMSDSDTITLGSSVEIDGNAYCGSGDYLYSFLYKKSTDTKWTVKQGFKDNDIIDFHPSYTGTYDICMKVKDSENNLVKVFTQIEVVEAFENQSTISADTITKGETVTVNAVAEEGMENCTYAFYYKKVSDTKWTQKQNYDTNSTVVIKPAYATDYQVCVKIKDENGSVSKKYFNLTVQPKA